MKNITENKLESLIIESSVNTGDWDNLPEGFSFRSTPGHGYLEINHALLSAMPANMRSTRFSSPGSFEEDCDWSIPVIFYRRFFCKRMQLAALKTLYNWHPEIFIDYFHLNPVDSYQLKQAS
jgi:hypothetical protein